MISALISVIKSIPDDIKPFYWWYTTILYYHSIHEPQYQNNEIQKCNLYSLLITREYERIKQVSFAKFEMQENTKKKHKHKKDSLSFTLLET